MEVIVLAAAVVLVFLICVGRGGGGGSGSNIGMSGGSSVGRCDSSGFYMSNNSSSNSSYRISPEEQ